MKQISNKEYWYLFSKAMVRADRKNIAPCCGINAAKRGRYNI